VCLLGQLAEAELGRGEDFSRGRGRDQTFACSHALGASNSGRSGGIVPVFATYASSWAVKVD
jgi:hypothetical protein